MGVGGGACSTVLALRERERNGETANSSGSTSICFDLFSFTYPSMGPVSASGSLGQTSRWGRGVITAAKTFLSHPDLMIIPKPGTVDFGRSLSFSLSPLEVVKILGGE